MMLGVCTPVHWDQWHPGGVWETDHPLHQAGLDTMSRRANATLSPDCKRFVCMFRYRALNQLRSFLLGHVSGEWKEWH